MVVFPWCSSQFANCYIIRVYTIFVSFSQGIYCKHQAMGISCRKYGCYMIDKVMVAWWLLLVDGTIYLDDQNHNKTSKPRNKAPMHQMTFCTIGWNWNPYIRKRRLLLGFTTSAAWILSFTISPASRLERQSVGYCGTEHWQSILAATKEVQQGSRITRGLVAVLVLFRCESYLGERRNIETTKPLLSS